MIMLSMYWRFKRLEEQVKQRATMQKCERCSLLYQKSLPQCPHCAGISDAELRALLAQRARSRKALAAWMIGAALIIVLLLAAI